jgi:TolA-binding protein
LKPQNPSMLRRLTFLSAILLCQLPSIAQQTANHHDPKARFAVAMDLYDKEKFSAALREFETLKTDMADPNSELSVNAEYFAALCTMELFHKDTRERLIQFVHDHPESQWVRIAYFKLAEYYYTRKRYKDALEWFEKVPERNLSLDELTEKRFKEGYSFFKQDRFSEAKRSFAYLTEIENRYYVPANYYFSHLSYEEGNLETALKGFERIKDDERFAAIVPYYIMQIYFLQERYQEVIDYGPALLDSAEIKKEFEVARIIGESFYNLKKYEEAVPYLAKYNAGPAQKNRDDYYQLGFAHYKSENYNEAIEEFNLVTNEKDKMGQLASYHMGDCYMKLDNKKYARNAFKESSQLDFDTAVKEDALFSYAKLAYELSANPFNEAIRAFEAYLNDYPTSPRRDEAYSFLLDVYMTTKNYEAALIALDKMENLDPKAQTAYQLCAYNRGVELYLNRRYAEAKTMFLKVDKYKIAPLLSAKSEYWKAEIAYQEEDYNAAISAYNAFQTKPGSFNSGFFKVAYYNTGYAYFMKKDYPNALVSFKLFMNATGEVDKRKENDAWLRMGDCAFVSKNYEQAINDYTKGFQMNLLDSDYALFQKSRAQGFAGNDQAKTETLKDLIQRFPNSSYNVSAKYQLAETYFKMDRNTEAFALFQDIITQHQGSPYVKKSLLTTGLIHYRNKKYEEAIAAFKRVVEEYPSDNDSHEAQLRIQDVYVELGRVDEFNTWYEVNVPTGSIATQDSVNYRIAENLYSANDCPGAITAFTEYLKKFQPGIFGNNASYYLGECLYKRGDKEIALNNYLYVIAQPTNNFSEPSLFSAATITYDAGSYNEALEHYTDLERVATFDNNILEARIGQMRCHFNLGHYEDAGRFADVVIIDDKTPEAILKEAHICKAKTLLSQGNEAAALVEFTWIDKESSGKLGAEAKFNIARIQYNQLKYTESEASIFKLINDYPSQEFWKVKAFMLLSDVYVAKKDYFQAKATLQSIMDNVSDESVQAEAMSKYEKIIALEKGKSPGPEEDVEINMGTGNDTDNLFED